MLANGLPSLRNRHAGVTAIIAGSGPSLRHLSPEMAEKNLVLAVNSSIIKFPRAQYYVTCDSGNTLRHNWQVLKASKATALICVPGETLEGFGSYDHRIGTPYDDGFTLGRLLHIPRKRDEYSYAFKPDDEQIIYGQSSAHCAVHVAYLMGCSKIVLIGCDCGLEEGKRQFWEFKGQEQNRDYVVDPKMEEYFSTPDTPILGSFVNYWERIGQDNPNLEIYNCGNAVIPSIEPAKLNEVIKA